MNKTVIRKYERVHGAVTATRGQLCDLLGLPPGSVIVKVEFEGGTLKVEYTR